MDDSAYHSNNGRAAHLHITREKQGVARKAITSTKHVTTNGTMSTKPRRGAVEQRRQSRRDITEINLPVVANNPPA